MTSMLFGFAYFCLPNSKLRENKDDDAKRIAIEQFGMEEVWVVAAGATNSSFNKLLIQETYQFPYYVLGIKNKEELFIVVPHLKRYPAYEIEWVFDTSFQDIVKKLNEFANETICTLDTYNKFIFIDNEELIKACKEIPTYLSLDVNFILFFDYSYYIGQSNHEILIFPADESLY